MIRGIRNGRIALYICSIVMFAVLAQINSDVPTGGVQRPIIRFRTRTTPRCTGSMPKEDISGIRNGTVIVITARASMNIPMIRNAMFRIRSMMYLLFVRLVSA